MYTLPLNPQKEKLLLLEIKSHTYLHSHPERESCCRLGIQLYQNVWVDRWTGHGYHRIYWWGSQPQEGLVVVRRFPLFFHRSHESWSLVTEPRKGTQNIILKIHSITSLLHKETIFSCPVLFRSIMLHQKCTMPPLEVTNISIFVESYCLSCFQMNFDRRNKSCETLNSP